MSGAKKDTLQELNGFSPIRTSSPRQGRLPPTGSGRSPSWRQTTLHHSMTSAFSQESHETEPVRRATSPTDSVRSVSNRNALRERNSNLQEEHIFAAPAKPSDLAPHPARLSDQHQKAQRQNASKRRSSGANQSFNGMDATLSGDEDDESFDGDGVPKRTRRRLLTVPGKPGRKPIGRRPNMDETILKKVIVPHSFTGYEDPFEMVKKTRERILGECAQNFFKVFVGGQNQFDDTYEINLYYRWWAQYNMFFGHEPMSRLITSTRGNILEVVRPAEQGSNFLVWGTVGICSRHKVPSMRELSKIFQVQGQISNKTEMERAPRTLNQLLVNIYQAVTHMEHMQQRFIPIGAALTMNNWITLANPSDVIINLARLRHFTRIALDYSSGPSILGNNFEKYFPEAWRELKEAENNPDHPDYRVRVQEPPAPTPNPFPCLRLNPEIPTSHMGTFISHWNRFEPNIMFKSAPLFAFRMSIRHRLFPMTTMRNILPQSIKDNYKDEMSTADKLDAQPYGKHTLMETLKEISGTGWTTLLMLLTRQTDTDEEKLLIQNHEGSPLLKLAKFYIKSEQKYGDTYIPPYLNHTDDPCIRGQNLGGNLELDITNDEIDTSSVRDFDTSSIDWNPNVL